MNKIIVSLTSYPARINKVSRVIECMKKQSKKPDKIVLYLAAEQFDNKQVPDELSRLQDDIFEIHWVEKNLKPHTKYFYAMQEYADDFIITVDDDIFYSQTLIEDLFMYYQEYPKAVHARRTHRITFIDDNTTANYHDWIYECGEIVGIPRHDLFATGVGGVLYPPHVFGNEVLNMDEFCRLSPNQDDLWLKVMELYYDIPVVLVIEKYCDKEDEDITKNSLSKSVNVGGNDQQWSALLKNYQSSFSGKNMMDQIKNDGWLTLDDITEKEILELFKDSEDSLKEQNTYVYGAGIIANEIYALMKKINKEKYIKSFVVDDELKNDKEINGISVINWREIIKQDNNIILGISKKVADEVRNTLISAGIDSSRIILMTNSMYKLLRTYRNSTL